MRISFAVEWKGHLGTIFNIKIGLWQWNTKSNDKLLLALAMKYVCFNFKKLTSIPHTKSEISVEIKAL